MKQCMDSENLHRRLRKILGQVQAIDRMIEEDIPCEDVLSQINAAKSASSSTRGTRWKEYYNFKKKYLLATNVINKSGKIIYYRDIDYGFAISSHKS